MTDAILTERGRLTALRAAWLFDGTSSSMIRDFGPAEALRTVTSVAAGVCGLGHRKGRIAPGFDADILAVDGDPVTDPGSLHRIRAVYACGTAVPDAEPARFAG